MNLGAFGAPGTGKRSNAWRMPRGWIDGLTLSNDPTDATNDLGLAIGAARSTSNRGSTAVNNQRDIEMLRASIKQLDVAWAPGNGGMRHSATAIANGTWHIFAIGGRGLRDDVFAYTGADPSLVLPAGYTAWRLIGSIVRVSTAIKAFLQFNDTFLWVAAEVETVTPAFDTTQRNYALTVPTGLNGMLVDCSVSGLASGAQFNFVTGHPDVTLATPTSAATPTNPVDGISANTSQASVARASRRVNALAQIAVKGSATAAASLVYTFGFDHPRGKDS